MCYTGLIKPPTSTRPKISLIWSTLSGADAVYQLYIEDGWGLAGSIMSESKYIIRRKRLEIEKSLLANNYTCLYVLLCILLT